MEHPDKTVEELNRELISLKKKYQELLKSYEKAVEAGKQKNTELQNSEANFNSAIVTDITGRKRAEENLRHNEQLLRMFVEHSPAAIAMFDSEMRYIIASKRYLSDYRLGTQDLTGRSHYEVFPEMTEEHKDIHRRCLAGAVEKNREELLSRVDGTSDWVRWELHPWYEPNGHIGGLIFFSEVITERKLAEEKTRESERKFRRIFESVQEVYFEAAIDGTWLEVSPSVGKIAKGLYSREEMIGSSFVEVYADPRQREEYFAKLIEQKSVYDYELLLKNKDGSTFPAAVSSVMHFDENGKPDRISGILRDITERKNVENALRETLEKLHLVNATLEKRAEERAQEILEISGLQKAILNNAPLAILTSNAEGIFQSINPAGEKMLGYSAGEIVGKPNPLLFHDQEEMAEFCRKTTGNPDPGQEEIYATMLQYMFHKTTEWTWVRKNGEKFFVRITHSSIIDDNGVLLGYMGLIIDITQEKQASDLLRQSEAENRAIIHAVPDLLFRIRRDGTYLDSHSQNGSPLYVPKEVFTGRKVTDILPPDLADQSMYFIEKAFITGEVVQYEYILPVQGKDCYFENRITAISGDEVLSIIRDITHRKESETALQMQSAAFESFALAIIITDVNGHIQWTNSAFTRLTGYSIEEAKGKTPGELVKSGKHDNEFYSGFWNAILGKKVWTGELINRKKDGTLYHEEQTITPVLDSQGKIARFIAIKIDITMRKQAQEELIRAKDDAEKANKAKSMFLSRMSHELRTPMNSILGFAQLLEMGELSQKQRKGVLHIMNNGKHLLDLINEVLDISGIEAGKQALMSEPIDLTNLIHEVTDSIQGVAAKRRVSIAFTDPSAGRIFILADRIRVRQILINLIGNAIKYNVVGGSVTIFTEIHPDSDKGSCRVRISITDTGTGINADDIHKLFQPFERIGADKTETEGTGLGLMVVKRLTEAMGGTVGVESTVGIGSTFWFELPVCQEPARDHAGGAVMEKDKIEEIRHEATILYVEDHLSNIELVDDILSALRPGIRLVTTDQGLKTAEMVREHRPAMILLDLDLPDIQGIEVLEQLLNDDGTKSIPVIVVSADAMPFQIEKLMKTGAKDYLTKPLDVARFLKTIDNYIRS